MGKVRSVTGVDIALPYLRNLPEGVRRVLANAEYLPFREEFDIIVSSDVLEHVLNPGSFLYCVYEALKPGGRFIVRVPLEENIMGWGAHSESYLGRLGHLRNFNKALMKMVVQDAGFKVLRVCYDGARFGNCYRYIRKYAVLRCLHSVARTLVRGQRLRKGIEQEDRSSDGKLMQRIYGVSDRPREMIVIARKPLVS